MADADLRFLKGVLQNRQGLNLKLFEVDALTINITPISSRPPLSPHPPPPWLTINPPLGCYLDSTKHTCIYIIIDFVMEKKFVRLIKNIPTLRLQKWNLSSEDFNNSDSLYINLIDDVKYLDYFCLWVTASKFTKVSYALNILTSFKIAFEI